MNHTFSSIAAYSTVPRLIAHADGSAGRVLNQTTASANLFATLGVAPMLGRTFNSEDERPGARSALLSHELWVSDFASSPAAVGAIIRISDQPLTVVGVLPAGFQFPVVEPATVFTSAGFDPEALVDPAHTHQTHQRGGTNFSVIGRLRSGTTLGAAEADLSTIQRALAAQYVEDRLDQATSVVPELETDVGYLRSSFLFLSAAVAALLLIACSNVAGLLLARAVHRAAQQSVRAALGATRRQLLQQLLAEAALISLAASLLGTLLAEGLLRIALAALPADLPRAASITIDARVLAFALLLGALTAVLFGALPAGRGSQANAASVLRSQSTLNSGSARLQSLLIAGQVALSLTLVVSAALLVQGFVNVLHVDPGIDTEHTLDFGVALTASHYSNPARVAYFHRLLPRLAALPGVRSASAAYPVPLRWHAHSAPVQVPGLPSTPERMPQAVPTAVEPHYFETLGVPLIAGRTFTPADDDANSAPVAIINQAFQKRYFPTLANPIGHTITPLLWAGAYGLPISRQIIGVVGDTRSEDTLLPPNPQMYFPYAQVSFLQRPEVQMRVVGDPAAYQHSVTALVNDMDPAAPIFHFHTFQELRQHTAAQQRFEGLLVSGFAVAAWILSAVGLYALLSYTVVARTREIAIRIAVGARRGHIFRLVIERGLLPTGLGFLLGLILSFIHQCAFHCDTALSSQPV